MKISATNPSRETGASQASQSSSANRSPEQSQEEIDHSISSGVQARGSRLPPAPAANERRLRSAMKHAGTGPPSLIPAPAKSVRFDMSATPLAESLPSAPARRVAPVRTARTSPVPPSTTSPIHPTAMSYPPSNASASVPPRQSSVNPTITPSPIPAASQRVPATSAAPSHLPLNWTLDRRPVSCQMVRTPSDADIHAEYLKQHPYPNILKEAGPDRKVMPDGSLVVKFVRTCSDEDLHKPT